jgi:hypothetical protein
MPKRSVNVRRVLLVDGINTVVLACSIEHFNEIAEA